MRYEITVPTTADGALEVTVNAWLKNVGEDVKAGFDLVEMVTEKITLYATSPVNGKLVEIVLPSGSRASVGDVVGYVEGA